MSLTASSVTCAELDDAWLTPSVILLVAPDSATGEESAQDFVAIGRAVRGTDTPTSTELLAGDALAAVISAVLVIVEPSRSVVSAGKRTPTKTCLTDPAGKPVDPAGFGGGNGSTNITFNVRVAASYETVWLAVLAGSSPGSTSKPGGSTSVSVASTQATVRLEHSAVS
jgi:hypothetical protein